MIQVLMESERSLVHGDSLQFQRIGLMMYEKGRW